MKFFSVTILCVWTFFAYAQTQVKTRQAGWQQKVDYTISVKLNDVSHTLSATETMVYTNNSPDDLKEIYIHLWPNAYKSNETAFAQQKLQNGSTDFYYSEDDDKGWIDSLDFKVDGTRVKWYLLEDIDICKLELSRVLKPGEKAMITTPFKVKIPAVFSRLGHQRQLYCISQWYPKPAVYDVNGWNYFPYLDQGEFYGEFGKFEVSISVPKNYVLAATGELQNEDEKKWLFDKSKNKFERTSEGNQAIPNSSTEFKTLRFVQDSVHDFAWFCDKRFSVERSEVALKSGRKVTTWLFEINPQKSAVHWVDTAILFYSRSLGEYPFNHATAVVTPLKAGAGMEYPTITYVENSGREVIVHEVGHNWFYGILANNERVFPWMDESMNTYYESRSGYEKTPATHKGLSFKLMAKKNNQGVNFGLGESEFGLLQLNYLLSARKNLDQPVNIPSADFDDKNYGMIIYGKAPLMFQHLQSYLGDSLFDAMMQSYYEKWKFKHPLPDDFFDHAKNFTGKDQDWFIKGFYTTTIKPDYKMVALKGDQLTIKNNSSIAAPFPVSSMIANGVTGTQWYDGFTGKKTVLFPGIKGDKLRIDPYETTLDVYRDNNTLRTAGVFKKADPIQFKFLGNIEDPYRTQIFYTPIAGANLYNKTMLGMAFYNGLLPQKKFDYVLTPMYSFGTKDIVGYANFERHFASSGYFSQVHVGISLARFAYEYFTNPYTYNKVDPFIRFDLNNKNKRSTIKQSIQVRAVFLGYNRNVNSIDYSYLSVPQAVRIDELSYSLNSKKAINKNSLTATIQHIDIGDVVKLFTVFKQTIQYDKPKKKLDIRLFGGAFLTQNNTMPGTYQFRTTGNTGIFDYTFDQALLGRSEGLFNDGLFARQLIEHDGNLHMPTSITNSNRWVVSANLASTLPGPIPIRPFVDAGYINSSSYYSLTGVTTYERKFQYVAGFKQIGRAHV